MNCLIICSVTTKSAITPSFIGLYGGDVAWRLAEHLLGGMADRLDGFLGIGTPFGTNGDDRRFIQHDALAAHVDQGVRGTEVDRQIVGK